MTFNHFQIIKAVIHFQADDENTETGDLTKQRQGTNYTMGQKITLDEITILMTGAWIFLKITKHKKVHESIQFFALGESTGGLQYAWNFYLYQNDREKGKIEKAPAMKGPRPAAAKPTRIMLR